MSVDADDRLIDGVDNRLYVPFRHAQLRDGGVVVIAQAPRHAVEVGRQLLHGSASAQLEFHVVVVVGYLVDAVAQFLKGFVDRCGQFDQHPYADTYAHCAEQEQKHQCPCQSVIGCGGSRVGGGKNLQADNGQCHERHNKRHQHAHR